MCPNTGTGSGVVHCGPLYLFLTRLFTKPAMQAGTTCNKAQHVSPSQLLRDVDC